MTSSLSSSLWPLSMIVNNILNRHLIYILIFFKTFLIFNVSSAVKIANLIPQYCDNKTELFKTIELNFTDPDSSVLQLGASILQGIEIVPNYECNLIVQSPEGTGLILTIRKSALNKDDQIKFRTGSNPGDANLPYREVVSLAHKNEPSSIFINYKPTVGVSPINAGFDLSVTVYREKNIHCGDDYDCNNARCISPLLVCDGYNNCGNEIDEINCPGHFSWWMVGILVPIAIIVVVLAIFVWIRMSKS